MKTKSFHITGFLQLGNELSTGHLHRFLKYNMPLFDSLVVFADNPTDGSLDVIANFADVLVFRPFGSFKSEIRNRRELLIEARDKLPQTDWFFWLDTDEVCFASRSELEKIIETGILTGADGISMKLVNLWRSEKYYRLDSGFNELTNIRMWKNTPTLEFKSNFGLHMPMHPTSIKKVYPEEKIKVIHFGFASTEGVISKFTNYKSLGQSGTSLWRLVDEKEISLGSIENLAKTENFGSRFDSFEFMSGDYSPQQMTIEQYFWRARLDELERKDVSSKIPFVTIVCLIYKGIDWLEFQYTELLKIQSELNPGEVEILFVANDATPDVINFLGHNNIPHVISIPKSDPNEWYINSVYRAYNYGAKHARGRLVLFVNSDMAYSQNFLANLLQHRNPGTYLTAKLIESGRLLPGLHAEKINLGKNLRRFKRKKFYQIATKISKDQLIEGGLYMPALVCKERFLNLGGYPEGNIRAEDYESFLQGEAFSYAFEGEKSIPGDRAFISKISSDKTSGMIHQTFNGSIAYHFQEGEKSTTSIRKNKLIESGVVVFNDLLIGINGEQTLWNHVINDLSKRGIGVNGLSLPFKRFTPNWFRKEFKDKILKNPRPRLIFQNGTYLKSYASNKKSLILLQDKVTDSKLLSAQNKLRSRAKAQVTNSVYFVNDKKNNKRSYLLPLPISDAWDIAEKKRHFENRDKDFQGIFIGAFNETKGWNEVRSLILQNQDVFFQVVSKYSTDNHGLPSDIGSNWRVHRQLSQSELAKLAVECDFFLLGSSFETQCLAAIECANLGLPILMKETGLLASLPLDDRKKVGVFADDLQVGLLDLVSRLKSEIESFAPSSILNKYGISTEGLRREWIELILFELENSFQIKEYRTNSLKIVIKKLIPSKLKVIIRVFIRK